MCRYVVTYRQTHKQTYRHTGRQADIQPYRHSSYREADRQIHIQDVYISAHAGARVAPTAQGFLPIIASHAWEAARYLTMSFIFS